MICGLLDHLPVVEKRDSSDHTLPYLYEHLIGIIKSADLDDLVTFSSRLTAANLPTLITFKVRADIQEICLFNMFTLLQQVFAFFNVKNSCGRADIVLDLRSAFNHIHYMFAAVYLKVLWQRKSPPITISLPAVEIREVVVSSMMSQIN